jgi:hypothetical protein
MKVQLGANDILKLMKQGKWPIRGMPQLRALVNKHGETALQYAAQVQKGVKGITSKEYNNYLGIMGASFYTDNPNGRPQAIEMLSLAKFCSQWSRDPKAHNQPFSNDFKTRETYKTQVVNVHHNPKKMVYKLVCMYLDVLRPALAERRMQLGIHDYKRGQCLGLSCALKPIIIFFCV